MKKLLSTHSPMNRCISPSGRRRRRLPPTSDRLIISQVRLVSNAFPDHEIVQLAKSGATQTTSRAIADVLHIWFIAAPLKPLNTAGRSKTSRHIMDSNESTLGADGKPI